MASHRKSSDLTIAIAKTVAIEYGLNISSAHFLAYMDDRHRFGLSRKRRNSFAEAVDSEVSMPLHEFSVFVTVMS